MNMVEVVDHSKLKLWTFLWGHGEYEWPGYMYGVFPPRINIKGGGVHQWYMTFGQQCSISVIKQCFSV